MTNIFDPYKNIPDPITISLYSYIPEESDCKVHIAEAILAVLLSIYLL